MSVGRRLICEVGPSRSSGLCPAGNEPSAQLDVVLAGTQEYDFPDAHGDQGLAEHRGDYHSRVDGRSFLTRRNARAMKAQSSGVLWRLGFSASVRRDGERTE